MIISRDVTFDKKGMWDWSSKSQQEPVMIADNHEEDDERLSDPTPDGPESYRRPWRNPQLPARLQDCVMFNDNNPSDEEIINFALFACYGPITFEEASSYKNWRKAMDDEIHAIGELKYHIDIE